MFTRDCECARDVIACAAGNKRIGSESARRETDRPVTDLGRSCEKSADSDHWLVNRCISSYIRNLEMFLGLFVLGQDSKDWQESMGVKRGERDRQRIASQDSNMGHRRRSCTICHCANH